MVNEVEAIWAKRPDSQPRGGPVGHLFHPTDLKLGPLTSTCHWTPSRDLEKGATKVGQPMDWPAGPICGHSCRASMRVLIWSWVRP